MSKPDDIEFTESSGNVFAELGVEEPGEALVKAELARRISVLIDERGLTQSEIARLLGVDQPKVSALVRGRLSGFSLDRLLRFLLALDRDVEIVIKPKPSTRAHGRVRVI
ncbi:MAG TPA: helix-turn-helix transcriptional regulator [Thermomicrobiaceae bacterium]|nr:helix-turn-helix transcriptional regulator [Thermomicrobiaceae bacterium]